MTVRPGALGVDYWQRYSSLARALVASLSCPPPVMYDQTDRHGESPANRGRPPHTDVTDEYGCPRTPGRDPDTTTESEPMSARKKESGLYYITRDGRELNLGTGAGGLLGGLERDLLFAHLNYAFRVVSQALRATATGPLPAPELVEQALPLEEAND